jgi:hypothetical protein
MDDRCAVFAVTDFEVGSHGSSIGTMPGANGGLAWHFVIEARDSGRYFLWG